MRVGRIASVIGVGVGLSTSAPAVLAWALAPKPLASLFASKAVDRGTSTSSDWELWYFFRLADCQVGAPQIRSLNAIQARGRVAVRGVLLDVPPDPLEATRVAKSFQAAFPLLPDHHGRWARALVENGYQAPLYLVRQKGRLVGAVSPTADVWAALGVQEPLGLLNLAGPIAGQETTDTTAPRRIISGRLRLVATVRSSKVASLANPLLVASAGTIVYVFDYGDHLLKAFDHRGRFLWSYGDARRRQVKFFNPQGVSVDPAGRALVFDPRTGVLSVISPSGELARSVQIRGAVQQVVANSRGEFWGFDVLSDSVAGVRFDSAGVPIARLALPEPFRHVPFISRTTVAQTLPGSDTVLTAFQHTDYLAFWYPGGSEPRLIHGVESTPPPEALSWSPAEGYKQIRLAPTAVDAALSVTADARYVYVLYAGRSAAAYRMIDIYERGAGRYYGTYRLPERASGIARTTDGLAVVTPKPTPSLQIWRIQSGDR